MIISAFNLVVRVPDSGDMCLTFTLTLLMMRTSWLKDEVFDKSVVIHICTHACSRTLSVSYGSGARLSAHPTAHHGGDH